MSSRGQKSVPLSPAWSQGPSAYTPLHQLLSSLCLLPPSRIYSHRVPLWTLLSPHLGCFPYPDHSHSPTTTTLTTVCPQTSCQLFCLNASTQPPEEEARGGSGTPAGGQGALDQESRDVVLDPDSCNSGTLATCLPSPGPRLLHLKRKRGPLQL